MQKLNTLNIIKNNCYSTKAKKPKKNNHREGILIKI
jgi:hypothetical protein